MVANELLNSPVFFDIDALFVSRREAMQLRNRAVAIFALKWGSEEEGEYTF